MILWKTIDIADNERALLFRRSRLERILEPGRYRTHVLGGDVRLEKYNITDVVFDNAQAKFLLNTHGQALENHLESFEMADNQLGLFYRDGHLVDILVPGSFLAVWKGVERIKVDVVDITDEYSIDEKLVGLLGRGLKIGKSRNLVAAVSYAEIPDEHVGLLTVNGKLEKILQPGSYGYWKFNRAINVKLLDLRLHA
ncbi:MAG: slipin family protein, partial [Pseudomonadota bacterium]|nr:slipin family protein [Pseudomonadota bacterium]